MLHLIEQSLNAWKIFKHPVQWRTWLLTWRARHGDLAAYDQLVRTYQSGAGAIALFMLGDIELAARATFLGLLHSYSSLVHIPVRFEFDHWLYRNILRESKRILTELMRYSSEDLAEHLEREYTAVCGFSWPNVTGALIFQQTEEQFQPSLSFLSRLEVEYREVLVLREILGLSDEAIAQITGSSPGTVQFRLNQAHMKIRGMLREESGLFQRMGEKR